MDITLFIAFLAATMVIVVTPGPAVALASSQAVKYGPRAAFASTMGDALGSVVHITVAVASLQALLGLASQILPALQILGGFYILFLAYQSFVAPAAAKDTPIPQGGYRTAFIGGFFSCVTNPKAIIFFAALFPGFIAPDLNVILQSLIYGLVFVLLDASFIMGYAMLARRASRSHIARGINIDRLSAFGFVGVGLLLIIKGFKELRALPT